MSEDFNQKILDIIEMLGSSDIKDNMAGGNEGSRGSTETGSSNKSEGTGKTGTGNDNNEQVDRIRNLIELFLNSKKNDDSSKIPYNINSIISQNDPKINLLKSIKPFLNSRRQNRLNKCINILQMSYVARLFKEQEEGS
jgi:hypothetical protein